MWKVFIAALASVAVFIPPVSGGPAMADDTTPAVVKYFSRFPIQNPPAQYDIVHQILDFASGAGTREHRHGGPGYVTVLEGQSTRRERDPDTVGVFGPGQSYTERQGVLHSVRATGRTRVFASFLLSPGSTQTMNDGNYPAPGALNTVPLLSRTTVNTQPGEFTLTQMVVEFAPGAVLERPTQAVSGLATVAEGEVAFRSSKGEVRRSSNGMFLDVAAAHEVRNVGSGRATVVYTLLVPGIEGGNN
jgi:quercetin dioxygenase-like cupin family protein